MDDFMQRREKPLRRASAAEQYWLPGIALLAVLLALAAASAIWWYAQAPSAPGRGWFGFPPLAPAAQPPAIPEQTLLDVAPDDARAINARQAFIEGAPVPAMPFVFAGSQQSLARATDCLAAAAWYEAGDDGLGQRSVVQVVVNRALNPAFPASICRVVFQGAERRTGCQFSFTCDGSMRRTPSAAAWSRARAAAFAALRGAVDGSVGYATHYHTDWVVPTWRTSLDKIAQVRTHLFYRWRGYWGTPPAFAARRKVIREEPIVPPLGRLSVAHTGTDGLVLDLEAEVSVEEGTLPVTANLPPPLAIENVAERSLRGSVVRGRSESSDHFFIEVAPTSLTGSYATAAIALCKGKPSCKVLGWRDSRAMAGNTKLTPAQSAALTFLYVRKDAENDRALWNCAQVERSNPAQCLPGDPAAVARLAD
jgi:spore germination cell wall hydrolase CwlJ-like protein